MSSAAQQQAKARAEKRIRGIIEKQAADGRLSGKELYEGIARSGPGSLNRFDRAEVAPILAQYIQENPDVRLKGVSKYTGVERNKDTGTIAFTPNRAQVNYAGNGMQQREWAPDDVRFAKNAAGSYTWLGGSAAKAAKGDAAAAPETPAARRDPLAPPVELSDARDTFNQAERDYLGGSSASPDLSLSGGNLFNSIYMAGQDQVDRYERRFLPYLQARSNLQSQEIGYATRKAINDLPDDLALPQYTDPFQDAIYGKKGNKSLFEYLKNQIA